MICERFKTRLTDFALGADDAEFRVHLEDCAACRAALDAERALLASIDRGLMAMVQGVPSGDFAAHVRRRMAEQSAAPRPWFAGWVPVTAAALALVVLISFWMIRRQGPAPETAKEKPAVITPRPPREPQMARQAPPVPTRPNVAGTRTTRPPREPQMATNREPEVLVPRGQLAAVMRIYGAVWSGKADGGSLVAEGRPVADLLKPLVTDELKISPLVIERLTEEGQPNGSSEKR